MANYIWIYAIYRISKIYMISRIFRIYSILRISWIYRIFSISRISRTLRTTGKFIKNIGYLTKDNIFQKHITLDIWIEGYIWYGKVTSFCKSLNLLNFVTSWKPKILISRYLWSYVWIIKLYYCLLTQDNYLY